ncbi:MAG: GWxTD domain-containing protein, partial [Acidobacteriota bacterium]
CEDEMPKCEVILARALRVWATDFLCPVVVKSRKRRADRALRPRPPEEQSRRYGAGNAKLQLGTAPGGDPPSADSSLAPFQGVAVKQIFLLLLLCSVASTPAASRFKDWIGHQVGWIASKKEKKAFKRLKSDAEREQFIDQFWKDRDPTPGTVRNEYKEEHYRRLKFVTENFKEGVPGWRTDRGRVFILHGPPVSRSYEADLERWSYNGNPYAEYYKGPINLVFRRGGRDFQERLLSDSSTARASAARSRPRGPDPMAGIRPSARFRLVSAGPNRSGEITATVGETDRYIADILRSPGEVVEERKQEQARRRDWVKELQQNVSSRVGFGNLDFGLETYRLRQDSDNIVLFRVDLPLRQFSGRKKGQDASVDLFCQISDSGSGYVVDSLDQTLSLPVPDPHTGSTVEYTNEFAVPQGSYELLCVLRDTAEGRTGEKSLELVVEGLEKEKLALSSPILTQHIQHVDPKLSDDSITYADARFPPDARRFDPQAPVFLYFQIFNTAGRSAPRHLFFDYQIYSSQEVQFRSKARPIQIPAGQSEPFPYLLSLDFSQFDPGQYRFLFKIIDPQVRDYALAQVDFQLLPAEKKGAP